METKTESKNNHSPLAEAGGNFATTTWQNGIDELNLAEFPLAAISDRIPDGTKTITIEDRIFDRVERRHVNRRIVLSGSDQYGLPTAKDDDVLLACVQISKQQDFRSPEVYFTRYELLKLLGWADDSKNYARLAQSLRRWKGLSIFSDRAFYDFAEKSWVNRDFGVFDTLYIYRKEFAPGASVRSQSRFSWNEVLFRSFQAGYLKRIDWQLYTSLQSPIAKRLYRLLDKRFYHGGTVELDLHELAFRKLRLSPNYNTAQIKRVIRSGIAELESTWQLKSIPDNRRYVKQRAGAWLVRFERKPLLRAPARPRLSTDEQRTFSASPIVATHSTQSQQIDLQMALTKRGVGPAAAEELATSVPESTIQTMVELFDWYNRNGQSRHAGFLVHALRHPSSIELPRGFESSQERTRIESVKKAHKSVERLARTQREQKCQQRELNRKLAFSEFWDSLSPREQESFEHTALDEADPTKRRGYLTHQGKGSKLFEQYRYVILLDQFERTAVKKGA